MKDRVLLKQLPNLLTLLNMVLGLVVVIALVWRGPGYRLGACALILLAGGVDALDGKLARLWDVESDFGKQLDSFAKSGLLRPGLCCSPDPSGGEGLWLAQLRQFGSVCSGGGLPLGPL